MKNIKDKGTILIGLLEKYSKFFEVAIAFLLLAVITIKLVDVFLVLIDVDIAIMNMEFESVLTLVFNLVIGIEFTKMLIKHTPETVLDVLLFVIARQMVVHGEGNFNILLGVIAIIGIFATKKYLVDAKKYRDDELVLEEASLAPHETLEGEGGAKDGK
ncbi:MAG: transporter [Lachnospiraceae bacterium]|nr:transporter [Lachnospiraceae bacterium]